MYLNGGRYKVTGKLGEGGFGCVYLAEDMMLGKNWAIKEMDAASPLMTETARAELSVLVKVSHPNIVRITDVFSDEEHIYTVMDYIPGYDLASLLKAGHTIPEKLLYRWCMELCSALIYLHSLNPPVIVRDLKPSNIMIRKDGSLTLIDFGAAADLSGNGGDYSAGSRRYAAPEQLNGEFSVQSDIYALGKVMDLMRGGRRIALFPFIIRRCTSKDRKDRWKSAREIKAFILLSKYMGVTAIGAVGILLAGILFTGCLKAGAQDKAQSVIEEQAFSQSLMCFYDLEEYEDASKYMDMVSEDAYPESRYYRELFAALGGGSEDEEEVREVLGDFDEFNEENRSEAGDNRYVKNAMCIAKAYMSLEDPAGHEKAEEVMKRVTEGEGCEHMEEKYEEGALLMLSGVLITRGREDETEKRSKFDEAVECLERAASLMEKEERVDEWVKLMMYEAVLCRETGEYERAIEIYDRAEEEQPGHEGIDYFTHLSLMMQTGCEKERVSDVWHSADESESVRNSKDYAYMKERVENYEKDDDIDDDISDGSYYPSYEGAGSGANSA